MMDKGLLDAVKEQVNAELYSAYLYLAMSSWAEYEGWKGIASWMRIQAREERTHALVLHEQILERGEHSTMSAIAEPPHSWESPLALFEHVYAHERDVTRMINNLATIAMENRDHAFYQFIQMFVKEQVEEEANASDICVRLGRISDNPAMVDALDKELGTRVFSQPFPDYPIE